MTTEPMPSRHSLQHFVSVSDREQLSKQKLNVDGFASFIGENLGGGRQRDSRILLHDFEEFFKTIRHEPIVGAKQLQIFAFAHFRDALYVSVHSETSLVSGVSDSGILSCVGVNNLSSVIRRTIIANDQFPIG